MTCARVPELAAISLLTLTVVLNYIWAELWEQPIPCRQDRSCSLFTGRNPRAENFSRPDTKLSAKEEIRGKGWNMLQITFRCLLIKRDSASILQDTTLKTGAERYRTRQSLPGINSSLPAAEGGGGGGISICLFIYLVVPVAGGLHRLATFHKTH